MLTHAISTRETFRDVCREEAVFEKSYVTASKVALAKRNFETKQDIKFQGKDYECDDVG